MTKIQIKGPIVNDDMGPVYDYIKRPATYPKKVADQLPTDGSDVEIDINSGGGLVDSGSEIYTTLRSYPGHVTANVVGRAASAASIVAMGADEVRMSPVASLMIHNVKAETMGDNREHAEASKMLTSANEALATAYEQKTGMNEEDILNLMKNTTWLNAKAAIKQGFADGMMFEDDEDLALTASLEDLMTPEQLAMGREMMAQENKPTPPTINVSATGITGKALADAYIKADNRAGKQIADGKAGSDGAFSLKVALKPGDQVRVTQTTDDGTSKPAVAELPGKATGDDDKKNDQLVTELKAELDKVQAELNNLKLKRESQNKWDDPFF
ncbi:ATP-dependent Clp protease proteolytic subunit [Lacticaseibacillus pabuli]|uniref:ATP-dependent Clp protease proteolytic subunit n=1 Tax=Lacticaseibacillus pabuli TaxID=3025672 RepID=A0ABY7WS15_9LACO|nr:head maturation protease, ClpP-related [Lacticaseibacillus sp. KACC 23028]WDF81819.1 ATP-dependent Clp protease proteolytic subunit [Lacticaseibacillus sp. KACC 23028]